jgi:CheY-like chemotaxis protein
VEPHAATRAVLRDTLTAWGLRVETAESLAQAVSRIRLAVQTDDPFSLAVVDVTLPDGDGSTLPEQLTRVTNFIPAIVLVLPSASKFADSARYQHMGFSACVAKPIRSSELQDAVRGIVGQVPRVPAPTRQPDMAVRPAKTPSLHILLAEDNLVNQRLSMRLLEKRGHSVVTAANGPEALLAISRQAFDLVLMDIQMPGMDGFEITSLIRRQEALKGGHLPIIALTANVLKGDEDRCLSAGMDGYIPKPFEPDLLFETIERLYRQTSAASA